MADDFPDGAGSSDSASLSPSAFVETEGGSISVDWGRLGKLLVMSPLAAYFLGITGAARSIGLFAQRGYGALADRLSALVAAMLGQGGLFEVAWASARADVIGEGIASFMLAVAVAALASWVASMGVRFLRG